MIICGKRKPAKRNKGVVPLLNEKEFKSLERVVSSLMKKYTYSVYEHELQDLKQTIWYLVIISKAKYDPKRGIPFEAWAYYYAKMKLRDHFWRGTNFPQTKGAFTLLHTKAKKLYE
ncbi:sigma factor [Mesoaciditoga lauensis]|uniref:sigma factor n=1 Tax=Mesoaciditoga lauensis TaxID=1495039 RepID=UPI00056CCF14|nr:sigma factor [Mesoaciditoga lauensis]